MTLKPTIQERAFQLTADFETLAGIRQQLVSEGYEDVDEQLSAPSFRKALKRMLRERP